MFKVDGLMMENRKLQVAALNYMEVLHFETGVFKFSHRLLAGKVLMSERFSEVRSICLCTSGQEVEMMGLKHSFLWRELLIMSAVRLHT